MRNGVIKQTNHLLLRSGHPPVRFCSRHDSVWARQNRSLQKSAICRHRAMFARRICHFMRPMPATTGIGS